MRILLVTPEVSTDELPSGGLANYVRRFSASLVDSGHEVTVLTYGRTAQIVHRDGVVEETVCERGPKWMTALDILTLRVLASTRTQVFRARSIAQRVSQLIEEKRVDIVQYPNLGALSLFHPRSVPCVTRFSSDTLLAKIFGGYDLENWWTIRQRCFWEATATRKSSGIYAPSALIAGIVGRRLNRPVDVIQPPVFPDRQDQDPSVVNNLLGTSPFLLFIGNINRLKGIPVLTEIVHTVLDRHPSIQFVVVGREGQANLTNNLLKAAAEHANRVHFTGVLPRKTLVPFITQAQAIIQPSLIDNLPNTLLEGMVHGRIVIGTRGASFDELITDGVDGMLCERNNASSLKEAIDRVLALDPLTRASIETAAKRRVSRLAPEILVPRTIAYFEAVISAHRQGKL